MTRERTEPTERTARRDAGPADERDPSSPAPPDGDRTVRLPYGDAPQQFADLTVPGADGRATATVVLIHGGFWRAPYDHTLMRPLADDLARRGYAVWNLEYRRIGDDGGGWPGTLDDVAAGVDALADAAGTYALDLERVAYVGHSAGGHLALWAAGRAAVPSDAPGGDPRVTPTLAIGQGAVVDLVAGAEQTLGNGAVLELLGGSPDEYADRYAVATPALGAGPEIVSIVGTADDVVPPSFSVDPAQPGAIELVSIEGADHFDLIDPASDAWKAAVDVIGARLSPT